MATITEIFNDFLAKLTQVVPGGDVNNRAIRTLSQIVTGQILSDGTVVDLTAVPLNFVTEFEGPWECTRISVSFLVDDQEGGESPDESAKLLEVGWQDAEGVRFPFVYDESYTGWSYSNTDQLKHLQAGDQIYVRGTGEGKAYVQVRGAQL